MAMDPITWTTAWLYTCNDGDVHHSRTDLPLASAQPATAKQVWVLLSHARDATDSYQVLDVSEVRVTGRHQGGRPVQILDPNRVRKLLGKR